MAIFKSYVSLPKDTMVCWWIPYLKAHHPNNTMTESSWFGTSAAAGGAAAGGAAGGWFGGLFGGTVGRVDGDWGPGGFVKARRTGFMVMKQHI